MNLGSTDEYCGAEFYSTACASQKSQEGKKDGVANPLCIFQKLKEGTRQTMEENFEE